MKNDPIVDEIHKVRAKMLDACDGNLEKLMDQFKEAEGHDKNRVVSPKLIRPAKQEKVLG
jgi:ribosomal 50S subunit-associated protein YjgA (DUF615 family)